MKKKKFVTVMFCPLLKTLIKKKRKRGFISPYKLIIMYFGNEVTFEIRQ